MKTNIGNIKNNYMDKQTIDLGFILKQFPEFKFSMDEFDDRLRLQKFVYLLQTFDIYLGYDFSWYLHGPYCSTLATCGFALDDIYDKIPSKNSASFARFDVQKRFKKFSDFINKRESDVDFLEISASLHYLKNTCTLSDEDVITKVSKKKERFTKEQCKEIWSELKKWKLV